MIGQNRFPGFFFKITVYPVLVKGDAVLKKQALGQGYERSGAAFLELCFVSGAFGFIAPNAVCTIKGEFITAGQQRLLKFSDPIDRRSFPGDCDDSSGLDPAV